jgi:acetylornithine aminotransferase
MTAQDDAKQRYSAALMNTFGPPKRVLTKGEGCYVWDADGNRYLDLLGGIAVNALGHAHPGLVAGVTNQLATLGHVSNFFASEPQIMLAERLVGQLGAPGKVFFTNSGTEANEAAFKMTRRTGRTHLVAMEGRDGRRLPRSHHGCSGSHRETGLPRALRAAARPRDLRTLR